MAQALQTAEQIKALLVPGHKARWGAGAADRGLTVVWVQCGKTLDGINPIRHHNLAWFKDARAARAWGRTMRAQVSHG